jgi:hypothetical protein
VGMQRVRTPAWRIAGSFVSWLLFTFSFAGLFQTAGVVIGLGGYCASGGPYVIQTECPESVVVFAPIGIFGMLIAVGIGLFLAQNFGTPLYLWAWPILFVGLGAQFAWGATLGVSIVTNILLGLMFVVMGLVPWWFAIRGGAQPFLLGGSNAADQPFAYEDRGRKSYFTRPKSEGEPIPATPGDWALSLGLAVVGIGLGAWLSVLAFHAVSAAG